MPRVALLNPPVTTVLEEEYDRPDFQWNNRPDPLYRRFGTARDPEAAELRIFLLRASGR